jgi:hypothetical protein
MYALVTAASTCAGPFVTLFARTTLQLSMDDIGKVFAWSALGSALTYLPRDISAINSPRCAWR